MTNIARDRKKSNFLQQTVIPSGATFDFVYNGTNYKIPVESMVAAFGTVGTLSQLGDPAETPVLKQTGTSNEIRNLENGSGVKASISVEGGAQLDHNFTQDLTGVPILSDPTAVSPTIRSIIAGTGISVAAQNGSIQVALSATPASNKTIIVNTISDFPTVVSGVITLENNTMYFITNDLSTSNRFVLGTDTIVAGSDGTLITLTYTGSGNMFTSVNSSNKIKDLGVSATSGTLLDVTGSGVELFQVISCRVSCDTIGTIDNIFVANFEAVLWTVVTDGLSLLNNNSVVSFSNNVGTLAAGTFLDLGVSTTDGFSFINSLGVLAAGSVFLSGAVDSGNINVGGLATVINTRAQGAGTPLNGIAVTDSLWEFSSNNGIPNSIDSLLAVHGGATYFVAAINTPLIIGSNWTFSYESRFEGTSGGRFTYTGKGAHISINAAISAIGVVVQSRDFEFLLYKNGVAVSGAVFSKSFNNTEDGSLSVVWQEDIETGDYLELWVQNTDTTDNITINSIQLGIS